MDVILEHCSDNAWSSWSVCQRNLLFCGAFSSDFCPLLSGFFSTDWFFTHFSFLFYCFSTNLPKSRSCTVCWTVQPFPSVCHPLAGDGVCVHTHCCSSQEEDNQCWSITTGKTSLAQKQQAIHIDTWKPEYFCAQIAVTFFPWNFLSFFFWLLWQRNWCRSLFCRAQNLATWPRQRRMSSRLYLLFPSYLSSVGSGALSILSVS